MKEKIILQGQVQETYHGSTRNSPRKESTERRKGIIKEMIGENFCKLKKEFP